MREEKRGMGYVPSPSDLRDYTISYKVIDLPTSFIVNHGHIKDQGSVGSCVAHAISSILETQDGVNYSTGWIYGYRPDNYYQGEGMIPSEALKTITKVGYLTQEQLGVNREMREAKDIVDANLTALMALAEERKAAYYARLKTVFEIKEAIYSNKEPVMVCIPVGSNGLKLNENYVALVPEDVSGGHAVSCYGWNEQGLLIQNSWGDDWANGGTFILPYNYPINESWLITFKKENQTEDIIVKPNLYFIRNLMMKFIKILKKYLKRSSQIF